MNKVNLKDVPLDSWKSPSGKFAGADQELSIALGRDPLSTDLMKRHPFDVSVARIAPGKSPWPLHSHSAQWEFYYVLSGSGAMRFETGLTPLVPGDSCVCPPGEAHTLVNTGTEEFVVMIIADNPIGESSFYPDSGKFIVRSPGRRVLKGIDAAGGYYEGEDDVPEAKSGE